MIYILTLALAQYKNLITEQEKQKILEIHNNARAEVGSPPLQWDGEMEQDQISCGITSFDHHLCEHIPGLSDVGENLMSGGDPVYAAEAFYNEKNDRVVNSLITGYVFDMADGHYSQMVWKDTETIACSKLSDDSIIRCSYKPAGNVLGAIGIKHAPGSDNTHSYNDVAETKPTTESSDLSQQNMPENPVDNSIPTATSPEQPIAPPVGQQDESAPEQTLCDKESINSSDESIGQSDDQQESANGYQQTAMDCSGNEDKQTYIPTDGAQSNPLLSMVPFRLFKRKIKN